jgi:hypothetical protein
MSRIGKSLIQSFLESSGKNKRGPKTLAMLAVLAVLLFDKA